MKYIVTFYDKDNQEIKGSIFDRLNGIDEIENREELENAIGVELTVDFMLAEAVRYEIKEIM